MTPLALIAVLLTLLSFTAHALPTPSATQPIADASPSPAPFLPSSLDITPRQVHLALGYNTSTYVLTFLTYGRVATSPQLQYGLRPASLNHTMAFTSSVTFTDDGAHHINRTSYSVTLTGLPTNNTIHYQITTKNTTGTYTSSLLSFRTIADSIGSAGGGPLRIGLIGDYGLVNGNQTHTSLDRAVEDGGMDVLVHVGDLAYNMDDEEGVRGDDFMQREESVVSRIPYMVAPGNHEQAQNFSHYRNRFTMPNVASGSPTNLYFSFNVGPVHFIALDVERYFFYNYYNMTHLAMQYEWLERDLQQAQRNAAQQPWIVAYGHRPMYCTHIYNDWNENYCTEDASSVRDGVAFNGGKRQFGLEKLFFNYGVDLYVSGHMHSYERTYPVYRQQIVDTHYAGNFGTWHLVVGAAGCSELLDRFDVDAAYPWSVARSDSYGYGVLTVYNTTTMHWAQILDEDESVLDEVWVSKAAIKAAPKRHGGVRPSVRA